MDVLHCRHLQLALKVLGLVPELLAFSQLLLQPLHLYIELVDLGLIGVALVCAFLLDGVDQGLVGLQLAPFKVRLLLELLLALLQAIDITSALLQIVLQLVVLHLQGLVLISEGPELVDEFFGVGVADRMQVLLHLVELAHFLDVVAKYRPTYTI